MVVKSFQKQFYPVELLGLSNRSLNALINNNIGDIDILHTLTLSDLRFLKGMGIKSIKEIAKRFQIYTGDTLSFGDDKLILKTFRPVDSLKIKRDFLKQYLQMEEDEAFDFDMYCRDLVAHETIFQWKDKTYYILQAKLDPMSYFELAKSKIQNRMFYIYEKL